MILVCLVDKFKGLMQKLTAPNREAERFLSLSVDRADFERREQQLKYKGFL